MFIYVCYKILNRCEDSDGSITMMVDYDEAESFTTMEKAVDFCKEYYANYLIAVEKCDEELFKVIEKEENMN